MTVVNCCYFTSTTHRNPTRLSRRWSIVVAVSYTKGERRGEPRPTPQHLVVFVTVVPALTLLRSIASAMSSALNFLLGGSILPFICCLYQSNWHRCHGSMAKSLLVNPLLTAKSQDGSHRRCKPATRSFCRYCSFFTVAHLVVSFLSG